MASKRRMSTPEALMLAPAVALMRLPLMAEEAQAGAGVETARAISEKTAAMAEGVVAAHLSMLGSLADFWPEVLAGRIPSILDGRALQKSMEAALEPAGRRVKANFSRLSRKR
jgi:hypothetical protein